MKRLCLAAAAALLMTGCSADGLFGGDSSLPTAETSAAGTSPSPSQGISPELLEEPDHPPYIPEVSDVPVTAATEYYLDGIDGDKRTRGALMQILKGLRDHDERINLTGFSLTDDEIQDIFDLLLCSEPELGWVDYHYEVNTNIKGDILDAYFKYNSEPEEEAEMNGQLRAAVEDIVSETEGMSDFERLCVFHDLIVQECDYDGSNENAWSAYGCLVEGRAVCEGYSKALLMLCEQAGILCIPVNGRSTEPDGELHMWNKVQLDGEWYNIDVTWDDPSGNPDDDDRGYEYVHHDYCCITDEKAGTDHEELETRLMKYPSAVSETDNYFHRKGLLIDDMLAADDVIYQAAAAAAASGERVFQLAFADAEVYNSFCAEEIDGEHIFDVLEAVANDGAAIDPLGYEYIANEDMLTVSLILRLNSSEELY